MFVLILLLLALVALLTVFVKMLFFYLNRVKEAAAKRLIAAFDAHEEDLDELLRPETFEPPVVGVDDVLALPSPPQSPPCTAGPTLSDRVSALLGSNHLLVPNAPPSLTKRRRSKPSQQPLACALAYDAAFKFGSGRPRSEANLLITRKWMRDRMEEYKDLRKKDLSAIIDIALDLSFYASSAKREMYDHCSTNAHRRRLRASASSWTWWPFAGSTPSSG